MLQYKLYGDGIHDDTDAIQERIDSGVCEVVLPVPEKNYLISRPLRIPSNFKLKLPRYAEIRLADGSNCFMLQNKTVEKPAKRLRDCLDAESKLFWSFCDKLSPDAEDACHDFEIEGGIWNFNNMNQRPNPIYTRKFESDGYLGHVMFFYNVRNFKITNLTVKDPANYAIVLDIASYFTIENIVFDFNFGNPIASNMDGIHLDGNCHYGVIRNLQGACYDDLVALNAHEGSGGDITNIEIDGIFAEGCHSAARLLTVNHQIKNITISNVFGTYYQYCIGFTKFYPGETTGAFDAITLRNIHASKAKRLPIQEVHMGKNADYHFPFIHIQEDTVIGNLAIEHLYRHEYINPVETIYVGGGARIGKLILDDIELENHTDAPCSLFKNFGRIRSLCASSLDVGAIENQGEIETLLTK